MSTPTPIPVRRNRIMLIAIFALFFGSMLLAGILRFSGWHPPVTKAHGELLQPPADLRALALTLADGSDYPWRQKQHTWRIALAPPPGCSDPCVRLGNDLMKVWQLMGAESAHVDVLWIGDPPAALPRGGALKIVRSDAALREHLPRLHPATGEAADGVPVYVIDPNGFVILRYAPGFDPAGLRADLAKLVKLI
jgi:hypothetical protein